MFKKTSHKALALGVLAVATVGTITLVSTKATTPTASFETENGTKSGNVSVLADATASGGSAVTFGGTAPANPMPVGVSGSWTLKFSDEFNGASIDSSKWNTNEGKSQNGVTNHTSNIAVTGGSAVLTLASSSSGAMLSSGPVDGVGNNLYQLPVGGYAEARVYFPGNGTSLYNWPAWWLVGSPNWPAHGENDIAEVAAWKTPSVMSVNYHGPGSNLGADIAGTWSNAYHVYGALRKASTTDFYYDGNLVKTLATNDDDIPQSLVFNEGLYSGQAGTFGAAGQLRIDYARAWEPGGASADTTAPSPPSNVNASLAANGTDVNLTWNASTDNVGVTGYEVSRDGSAIGTATSTSYTDAGRSAGQSYTYTIVARDAAGNRSAASAPITVSVPSANTVTLDDSAVGTGLNQFNYTGAWTADTTGAPGAYNNNNHFTNTANDSYSVQFSGTQAKVYSQRGPIMGIATYSIDGGAATTVDLYAAARQEQVLNYTSPTLSAGTHTLTARNTGTKNAASGGTYLTADRVDISAVSAGPDTTPPTAPTGLTATAASPSSIQLSWSAATDNVGVTSYQVFDGTAQIASLTGLAYTHTGLAANSTHTYTVKALDAAGNVSAASSTATATTPAAADTTPPSAPSGLAASVLSATQVKLTWNASTDNVGVNHYNILRGGVVVGTTPNGTLTYTDTSAQPSTTYNYTVKAVDAASNESGASNAVSATTPALADTTAPSVPGGVTAVAVSTSQINVSWNASTDNVSVKGYRVFRGATQVADVTVGTTYGDTGLTAATSYTYSVQAYDAAGNVSAASSAVSATTLSASGNDPVIAIGGDVGYDSSTAKQAEVAALITSDSTIQNVIVPGDLAYPNGTASDFSTRYNPSWGPFKAKTVPSPGNHEYNTSGGSGYYAYFNGIAKYYSQNIGTWHIISMNSQEDHSSTGAQGTWLKNDLAASSAQCTLAFAHYPRFSSGSLHGDDTSMQPFWQILYDANADVIIGAHDHHYERFKKQTPAGALDATRGIESWVTGMAGADPRAASGKTNTAFKDDTHYGILKMTLHPTGYDYKFVDISGVVRDSGSGTCH